MSIASEITRIKNNIAGAYTKAAAKGATLPANQNSNNLASTIDSISSGIDINGIIEEYLVASGGNVSAGDFVEFINQKGTDTAIKEEANTLASSISAVLLSDNTVFIAHGYDSNCYLYGMVCTVNGTTITAGADTRLSSNSGSGFAVSAVALSDNKVFVANSYSGSGSSTYLYGMVCTINGTTITAGTNTQLNSNQGSANRISAIALSDNKVFIGYCYGSSNVILYVMVCTINGTTITTGVAKGLWGYSGYRVSLVALSDNKVFVAHSYSGNNNDYGLYGVVCTINGTTITMGTDTKLIASTSAINGISVVALSDNKVFIAHTYYASYNYLYGTVCTINETAITVESDTQLKMGSSSNLNSLSVIAISDNKVFIAYSYSSSYYVLFVMVCTINGTTITMESDTQLSLGKYSGSFISAVLLFDSKVFIAHSYSSDYYLNGITYNLSEGLTKVTNSAQIIKGVAKTSGSAGETVQVYVPAAS